MVIKLRILDKINEIESYLEEFKSIIPKTFDEYINIKEKAACERYFEKIIESIVDLCFLIIKDKNLEKPEDDKSAFDILFKNKIISEETCDKLKDAKGMKNIISHKYGYIDNRIVFDFITEKFLADASEFLDEIKRIK